MQKIVVGLGNPGEEHKKTRHNAGFFVVDALEGLLKKGETRPRKNLRRRNPSRFIGTVRECGGWGTTIAAKFTSRKGGAEQAPQLQKKERAINRATTIKGRETLFLKPQTGMNSSGEAVRKAVEKHDIDPQNLLVIHDDLDIPRGEYKLQRGRGAAGHNGVRSVIDALGTRDFWRLRVGIGRPEEGTPVKDYVLGEFSNQELNLIRSLAESELAVVVKKWVED